MAGLRPDRKRVFIDRQSGGRVFRGHLSAAGIDVVLHDEHFGPSSHGTPSPDDSEWLVRIGRLGWIIVSADLRTITEPMFLRSIPASGATVFLMKHLNHGRAEERARHVIEAYPKMCELVSVSSRPAIWICDGKKITGFDWRERIARWRKYGRL